MECYRAQIDLGSAHQERADYSHCQSLVGQITTNARPTMWSDDRAEVAPGGGVAVVAQDQHVIGRDGDLLQLATTSAGCRGGGIEVGLDEAPCR